jgi:hypothetical protein
MGNIDLCIWGCRDGFEVIYSENENWKSYILSNESELDGKHQKVCTSLGEFYTLNKIDGNQVFSLVVPSIDIIPRQTYMVISLISRKDVSYGTQILEVLNRIWQIYKRDNFSSGDANNQGQHLTYNNFNIQDFRSQIDSIKALSTNHFFQASNCTILIDDINVFKNEFGRFKGNAVYFVNNNTEQNELKSALSRLPKEVRILKEIVSKGPKLSEIDELKKLIVEKQNIDRAKQLFQIHKTGLNPEEVKEFTIWYNNLLTETEYNKLISFTLKQFLTSEEKEYLLLQSKNKTAAYLKLNDNQIQILNQKLNSVDEIIEKLRKEIDNAENIRWNKNPLETIKILKSNQNFINNLGTKYIQKLESWEKEFNKKEKTEIDKKLTNLYNQILKSNNKEKKKNQNNWETEILDLSERIISIKDEEYTKKLKQSKRYIFLTNKEWFPKDRLPLLKKLILSIFILIVFTFGYFIFNLDTDNDGIINLKDDESKTKWFDKDNSKYNLKDYVTSNGLIDPVKTKKLCDCWKFPKTKERKILKCSNNLNWFIIDAELYEYRKTEKDKGYFYLDSTTIAKDSSGKIKEEHKNLFPENYPKIKEKQVDVPKEKTDNINNHIIITISYNHAKYHIKKGFTTKDGMEWNKSYYRFNNNNWEKKSSEKGDWKEANKADIDFVLAKCAKIITNSTANNRGSNLKDKGIEKSTDTKNTDTKKIDNNPASVNTEEIDPTDKYWLGFIEKSDEQIIEMKKNKQINFNATKPKSTKAKEVYNRIKNVN